MNLITGANGFVGARLADDLCSRGIECRLMVRGKALSSRHVVSDLNDVNGLASATRGVKQVFHCAGYAHSFSGKAEDLTELHWKTNFEGTKNLLKASAEAGVERFIFLSSVKAMGEPGSLCLAEDCDLPPLTPYGRAKKAAEDLVLEAGEKYGMHVVNLRLAMVYGRGGRGNLERMARAVRRGYFPPLPEVGNHRSIIHVDDVVEVISVVSNAVEAAGKTYIVANFEAPSGRELYDAIRVALGKAPSEWSFPASVLRRLGELGNLCELCLRRSMPLNSEIVDRLLGGAWYSPAKIESELRWRAQIPLAAGLMEMLGNEKNH